MALDEEGAPVRVAIIDVDADGMDHLDDPRLLGRQELERAAAFQGADLARWYRRAHAALRLMLSHETGLAPGALPIQAEPGQKPFLRESEVRFNLSHSAHLAAIAIARGREVGIDIEVRRRPIDEVLAIAAANFHEEECMLLARIPAEARDDAFLRLWTAREAYFKAIGTGLAAETNAINAAPFLAGAEVIEWNGWAVRALGAPPGAFATVAGSGLGWALRSDSESGGAFR